MSKINKCRLCGCQKFINFIDFGETHLANNLLIPGEESAGKYPLNIVSCYECGLFQLDFTLDPNILFKDYNYVTSKGLEEHFKSYAHSVVERLELKKTDIILEIGGNSGVLCQAFKDLGFNNVINVEPASNIAKISEQNGIKTYNSFFNNEFVTEFLKTNDRVQLVVANNVLAHLGDYSDYQSVFDGIQNVLEHNGTLIMENAYWYDTLEHNDFGQCYLEHSCYHLIVPLFDFFMRRKMHAFFVERVETQGGSFRLYVQNSSREELTDKSIPSFMLQEARRIFNIKDDKDENDLRYTFKENIKSIKFQVREYLEKNKDKKIGLVGVTAKVVLMLEYFDIADYFFAAFDDASLKIGKTIPGTNIKIRPMIEVGDCEIGFLGAYNFKDFIINRFSHLPITWVTPIPEFKVEKI